MAQRYYKAIVFLILVRIVLAQGIRTENYIRLIKSVYNYYGTSYVFFMQSGNFEDLMVTNLMHKWTWDFSQQRLFSVAMTFPSLLWNSKRWVRPPIRPLHVVLLNRPETLDEFIDVTGQINDWISEPVWLVIFMEHNGLKPLAQICENPNTNFLKLKFNTEMLVVCYDQPILREWYAVDDDVTRTYDLALWRSNKVVGNQLELLTSTSLYGRRENLFNATLRIATVRESSFMWVKNKTVNGFLGRIISELSRTANFTLELLEPKKSYGNWNNRNQSWTGVIGQLVRNEADIGVAEFTMTNERLTAVDFTLPLLLSRNRLYFMEGNRAAVQWSAHFQAFDYKIWSAIIILIGTTPLVLSWLKTKGHPTLSEAGHNLYIIIIESYTRIFGIYCQQGLSEFPTQDSLRMAYFSIFISALIIYSAYSAALISFLTVVVPSMPFSTFEEFGQDHSYKLIVFQNSADYDLFMQSADPVLMSMKKVMKPREDLPPTIEDGFKQVCTERVGFYTTEVLKETINFALQCKIVYVETGRTDSLAISLAKASPYTGLINYHLQRFQDSGLLARLKEIHSPKTTAKEPVHLSVSLMGVAPILAILGGGIVLACFILTVERVIRIYRKKARKVFNQCRASKQKLAVKFQRQREKIAKTKATYLMNCWH